jgi:hypothetical protein
MSSDSDYNLVTGFLGWLTNYSGIVQPFYTQAMADAFGCFEDFALEVYLETCL